MPSSTGSITEDVKRKIGQHFVVGFTGKDVTAEALSLIRDYHVGAIIIMKRNVQDIPQLRSLIARLQSVAKDSGHKRPLLIGIDQENGLVSAFSTMDFNGGTFFPGAMALGATNDPDLAEKVNASTGREMRLAGINWAYSPVCDINSEPRNPVIGVRSFGDDPETVSKFTAAVARGLASAGIAPSPKHFPGHGDTHIDSHLGLPRIEKTRAQLDVTELVPFQKLIKDGVATIMTGHMALPLIVGNDTPCSLSREITTDLLRVELGYSGVVVTDCLEMDAVVDTYGTENGAVRALQAGADMAMICHRIDRQKGAIEAVYEAVLSGKMSLDELEASQKRIQDLKDRFVGSWAEVLQPDVDIGHLRELKDSNKLVSQDAYVKSVTIIRDETHIVPLKPSSEQERIFVLTPAVETLNRAVDDAENIVRTEDGKLRNTAGPSYVAFAASVSRRVGSNISHVVYGAGDGLPEGLENATIIIFATRNGQNSGWQLEYLRSVRKAMGRGRLIVLATLTPYEILTPIVGNDVAYMCSFEFTPAALDTTAAVIFGESQATGRLPVCRGEDV